MKPRHISVLAIAVAGLATAACDAAAPVAAPGPDAAPLSRLAEGIHLVGCTPMPADSATAPIGPSGGRIVVGPHTFTVPAGALDSVVTITAVAPSDTVNRVLFEPTGLTFRTPATLEMSYANCGVTSLLPLHRIAYIDSSWNILDVLTSLDNVLAEHVSAHVQHFSDYAVAW